MVRHVAVGYRSFNEYILLRCHAISKASPTGLVVLLCTFFLHYFYCINIICLEYWEICLKSLTRVFL